MWLPCWPHSSKGCDTWLNVQNGSWRHRPAWGAQPPLTCAGGGRTSSLGTGSGVGETGAGAKCREQALAPGPPVPCQHPHAQPAAWPASGGRESFPLCQEAAGPGQQGGWQLHLAGRPAGALPRPTEASVLTAVDPSLPGWPSPSSPAAGPGRGAVPREPPGCAARAPSGLGLRPAWGSV